MWLLGGPNIQAQVLPERLLGQRRIDDAEWVRHVRVLFNVREACLFEQVLHPAEVKTGLVVVVGRALTTVDQSHPRAVAGGLEVFPVFRIDPDDPVQVWHRQAQLGANGEQRPESPYQRSSLVRGEVLKHMTSVDGVDAAGAEVSVQRHQVTYKIGRFRAVARIDVQVALNTDRPASQMQAEVLSQPGRAPSKALSVEIEMDPTTSVAPPMKHLDHPAPHWPCVPRETRGASTHSD